MASALESRLADPAATEAAGAALARSLPVGAGCICVHLCGELGAGKTTLARGLLRALGHAGRVPSPTYTLVEPYELAEHRVWHLDLYRLGAPGELEYLGLADMLEAGAILLVEWPERGTGALPDSDLNIELKVNSSGRLLRAEPASAAGAGILEAWRSQLARAAKED